MAFHKCMHVRIAVCQFQLEACGGEQTTHAGANIFSMQNGQRHELADAHAAYACGG